MENGADKYDATSVLAKARARGVRMATAESCTGGLVAARLSDVAGCSDVFECGFVTYSNASKHNMLGVEEATLQQNGAVSEEVAREMAHGARRRSGGALAVSITGIAGPGNTGTKPEGRVCFAIATSHRLDSITKEFGAIGRDKVRQAATEYALALLGRTLDDETAW